MIKHSIPIAAHFDWALAVTFALPYKSLEHLASPGLALDTFREHGFLAAACVQTRSLRPAGLSPALGLDFRWER